jgi:hypothetical protein
VLNKAICLDDVWRIAVWLHAFQKSAVHFSLVHTYVQCPRPVRALTDCVKYFVSTPTWRIQSIKTCGVKLQLECVRVIYILMRKNGQISETCLEAALVQRGSSPRIQSPSWMTYRGWSRTQEFRHEDETWLWDLALEIGPRIQRKDTKYLEAIPASIILTLALWCLGSCRFSSASVVMITFFLQ